MTWDERRKQAWELMGEGVSHALNELCRELIAELDEQEEGIDGMRLAIGDLRKQRDTAEAKVKETNGALYDSVKLIAKLSDDRDRLRRRDEVVREWLRQDEEMAGIGAGLADRLAAIDKQEERR